MGELISIHLCRPALGCSFFWRHGVDRILSNTLTGDGLGNRAAAPGQRVVGVVVAGAVAAPGEPVLYLARVVQLVAADRVVNGVRRHHDLRRRRSLAGRYQLRRALDPRRRLLEEFDGRRDRDNRVVLEQRRQPLVAAVTADRYAFTLLDRARGDESTPRL